MALYSTVHKPIQKPLQKPVHDRLEAPPMLARREIPELPPKTQDGIRKACRNFTSHFFSALSSVRDSLTDDSRGEETVRYDGTDTEQSFHSWSSRVDNWDDPEARLPYPIHDIIDPIDPVDPTNSIATELVDPRRRNLSPPVKPPLPARRTPLYDDSPDWIRYDSLEIANSQHVHCPPGLARSRPTSAIMADSQQPPDSVATPAQSAAALGVSALKCCCGSVECAFLRHNNAILDSVERDVHQAARMGQALLARHESYMADAERDRVDLTARIERLESDNKELEAMNARMIDENRDLIDQLEALNNTVADSEFQVKTLEATLLSSQQTIRRLEAETARAEALERQIASLEEEQAELQGTLLLSREEAKSAASRWKRAERGINDLQEQLERIEQEAKAEREHHVEMMGRIERQREMEKELNTAAGRLKGAAAAKSVTQGTGGSSVVGHFVRDLLHDNAALQCGIAELREMLLNSNDEIQALRDQLEYHQPLGDREGSRTPTLRAELEPLHSPVQEQRSPTRVSQELHIHHHYHVPSARQDAKKPKKKRLALASNTLVPSATSLPSTPPSGLARHSSVPHSRRGSVRSNRWSPFSEQRSEVALSSGPSSPRSINRNSLFDPPAASFPGSPSSSIDPISPSWHPTHKKRSSAMSTRSFQVPTCFPFGPNPPSVAHPIVEESDSAEVLVQSLPTTDHSVADDDESLAYDEPTDSDYGPVSGHLRRVPSQESIVSLPGGLEIHTLQSRPGQRNMRQPGSASSVTGSSIVTARPLISRDSAKRSSALLRDNFALLPANGLKSPPSNESLQQQQQQSGLSKLGRWAGWMPWAGGVAASSPTDDRQPSPPTHARREKDTTNSPNRSPGINQPGIVPGFSELLAVSAKRITSSTKTSPDRVDRDALRDGLDE